MFMPLYSSLDRTKSDDLAPEMMEAVMEQRIVPNPSAKARPFDQVIEAHNLHPNLKRYSELKKDSDRNKLIKETSLSSIKNSIVSNAQYRQGVRIH